MRSSADHSSTFAECSETSAECRKAQLECSGHYSEVWNAERKEISYWWPNIIISLNIVWLWSQKEWSSNPDWTCWPYCQSGSFYVYVVYWPRIQYYRIQIQLVWPTPRQSYKMLDLAPLLLEVACGQISGTSITYWSRIFFNIYSFKISFSSLLFVTVCFSK